METEAVPISLPLFRIDFSTQSVYETHESFNCYIKKIKYTADSLFRRYSANCETSKGIDYGKGKIDFSLTKSGLPDKFREISTAALPKDIIFGDSCGLQRSDTHSSTGESKCNNESVSFVSVKRSSGSARNCSTDWGTKLLCRSSSGSPSPLHVLKKETNSRIFNAEELRGKSLSTSGGQERGDFVDKQPKTEQ